MVEWTASDIALVISTASTGMTALAAFALPPISSYFREKTERRKRHLEAAFEKIEYCVSNMDEVVIHLNSEGMRLAFFKSGAIAPDLDKERERKYVELQSNARKIGLLSRYLGVDPRAFELSMSKLFSTRMQYEVVEGNLAAIGGNEAISAHWKEVVQLMGDVLSEGAKLLAELQQNGLARLVWRAFSSLAEPAARKRWGSGSRAMNAA